MLVIFKSEGLRCSQQTLKISNKNTYTSFRPGFPPALGIWEGRTPPLEWSRPAEPALWEHPAEATAHAPSGQPHPSDTTSKVTDWLADHTVQLFTTQRRKGNSVVRGEGLASPGVTMMLSQQKPGNLLCDQLRAAVSKHRSSFRSPCQKEPIGCGSGVLGHPLPGWILQRWVSTLSVDPDFLCVTSLGSTTSRDTTERKCLGQAHSTPGFSPAGAYPGNIFKYFKISQPESLNQRVGRLFSIKNQTAKF